MSNFEVGKKYIREGFNKRFDTVYTVVMADSKGAVLENPRGRRDWYNADECKEFKEHKEPRKLFRKAYLWDRGEGDLFFSTPFNPKDVNILQIGYTLNNGNKLIDVIDIDWVEKT